MLSPSSSSGQTMTTTGALFQGARCGLGWRFRVNLDHPFNSKSHGCFHRRSRKAAGGTGVPHVPPRKEPSSMLSGWVGMAVGGRHDFAHNHQRTPRGMARADFSSSYSRSCGHIGARNPCRQRRCQRGRRLVDDGPRYLRHCCNAGRLHRRKRPICSRGRLTRART